MPPLPAKPRSMRAPPGRPAVDRLKPVDADRTVRGALSGKTIYVSAGHGWTWLPAVPGWRTQREDVHQIVEDLVSTETVSYYLIPYLHNMGAYVVPIRESDPSGEMSIVDDSDPGFSDGGASLVTDTTGYATPSFPLTAEEAPFSAGTARRMKATSDEAREVSWTFDVPADGEYNVYVGYVQDASRAPDAHYVVRHAGGEAHFRVDQRRHGGTWVLLGRFYFERGESPEYGAVALISDSEQAGATLSADVARIGGGGALFDRGGGVHDRPSFEMCARYNTQLLGAPPEVFAASGVDRNDDIGARSRFAAWDHEDGEDAVYVAWHTNAPSPARGTTSFAYGPSSYGPVSDFSGVPGSLELMDAVHGELIGDLRAMWDPDWRDVGEHTAFFGEVNPNLNPEMPAVLFEVAFHDTLEDADALRDPGFRRLAARAIAQGIARYFAARDGETLTLPPEPPTSVAVTQGEGGLRVSWSPPADDPVGGDAPDGYRVYLSRDGRAFDGGVDVDGESTVVMPDDPSEPVYARVTAINGGGESLPSPVVGGRVAPDGAAPVLIVNGFSRLDGAMMVREDLSAQDLGVVDRGYIERINDRSYVARYGEAVDAFGASFDSADAGAVIRGAIDLGSYQAVIWFAGEQTAPDPIAAEARAALAEFVDMGGAAFVSGTEIAWGLTDSGQVSFLEDVLRVGYVSDDADSYAVTGAGAFDDLGELAFDDRGAGGYDADHPDVLGESDGSEAVFRYGGGSGGTAATLWENRVLVFAFPFETIAGTQARADVMARVLSTFGVEPDPDSVMPQPDSDTGCGCQQASSGQNWLGSLVLMVFSMALSARWHRRKQRRARAKSA